MCMHICACRYVYVIGKYACDVHMRACMQITYVLYLMHACVQVYVCMCVCVYVRMYVCRYVCEDI